MDVEAALLAVEMASRALTAIMNAVGASSAVSGIIAGHVQAGTNEWTDAERQQIRQGLADAKAQADADITAAGG